MKKPFPKPEPMCEMAKRTADIIMLSSLLAIERLAFRNLSRPNILDDLCEEAQN